MAPTGLATAPATESAAQRPEFLMRVRARPPTSAICERSRSEASARAAKRARAATQAATGRRGIPASRAEVAQLLLLAEGSPLLEEMVDLSDFSRLCEHGSGFNTGQDQQHPKHQKDAGKMGKQALHGHSGSAFVEGTEVFGARRMP